MSGRNWFACGAVVSAIWVVLNRIKARGLNDTVQTVSSLVVLGKFVLFDLSL